MRRALCVAMILCVATAAYAGVEHHEATVSLQSLNISTVLTVPKYDGTCPLTAVKFTLSGHVEGEARYENESPNPATVTWALSAIMKLNRPIGTALVVTLPSVGGTDPRAAYDGLTDWAGASGNTWLGLTADKAENATYSGAADLALFTATVAGETIDLPFTAVGTSSASGSANMSSQFIADGSAKAEVDYIYRCDGSIPEPAGLSLIGMALLGLRRRRG